MAARKTNPKPATPAAPKDKPLCRCGCGERTGGGSYRPGHDARHVSQLKQAVVDKTMTRAQALAAARKAEFSPLLLGKLEHSIDLATAVKAPAEPKPKAAPAAPKAGPVPATVSLVLPVPARA